MKSSEIRNAFIEYFKRNGHAHVGSSSLIPENDPTLLFANAGMNQFKNLFLGLEHRDYKRAVTVQKCVRAGGKHNDLENVGFTARHHTFFEMLGNFSFGDYFKKDAIHFAWELLTKDLGIPKEKLYVTVFQTDDEAADIWHKQEGIPKDRIFRLGEKDNFWRMGDVGPCGPCTEIFYDHGPRAGREADPFKGIIAGEDRFIEIWNLVFMQFEEKAPGKMEPLPRPSVDTGSGLERVTAALQGKLNNYDTDLFWPLITRSAEISKKMDLLKAIEEMNRDGIHNKISPTVRDQIAALRVIADHTRSCSLLLADGALPSNEGRGYVLRRILRRAVRFSQLLSGGDAFLPEIAKVFISEMSSVYPELKTRQEHILTTLRDEQDRFMQTLGTGTHLLEEELKKLKSKNQKEVSGEVVFKLYDTFGFPVDLTRLMAAEQGFTVDEKKFESEMEAAREKAKASWKGKGIQSDEAHLIQLAQKTLDKSKPTVFTGYEGITTKGQILTLSNGQTEVSLLKKGEAGILITDKSPFYAEGGGQCGDSGSIKTDSGEATVHNTTKVNEVFLHHVEVTSGEIKSQTSAHLQVSSLERRRTASNHSATHLLHAALRNVLGTHVTQAGSLVDSVKLRFDFTHNKALTSDELNKIEGLVNDGISQGTPVEAVVTTYKSAIENGAMALFGEKYGDQVRMLKMGNLSTELCGGTHVSNTAQIRMFKIVSESGVSAGVRRIEALTGDLALQYLMKNALENQKARSNAGLIENWSTYLESKTDMSDWIEGKKTEIKNLEKEIKKLQGGQVNVDSILQSAKNFFSKSGEAKFVCAGVDIDDRDVLAQLTDQIKNKIQTGVVIVVGKGESSHPIIVSVSKDLNPEITAGFILKEFSQVMGGKGGGRPDFAQGAAPDRTKLGDAEKKITEFLGI
ncbi:MAG: alanine--tRNA ligase [Oligoflexia bacterium]|nr:MAG: alanine--tRNA ligase [Oligoflexia bacterium]